MLLPTLLTTLALSTLTAAHFVLLYPPSSGFDEDTEPTSPCGGFTPSSFASAPSLQVDRFQTLIQNVHPMGEWSFRGTVATEAPWNFTEIVPVVKTTGVVDNSPDGILYQCAAVQWVAGSNNTVGSACTNSSSNFEASWTTLEGFKGEDGGSSSGTSASPSSATAGGASSSSTGAAPVATGVGGLLGAGLIAVAGLAL
ncbi:uncharacterized protein LTR77_000574 [Saxophila tyrrhenica]|uniref:Copper acquisition factor BIM1-like domain-containing protein n=1 Tax=Saxophila tyrrhenica TaxID=1690608 RepID=A0AAV9PRR6_9PEZI|nr:hypothetical protein LTR77_000574 [Saxophila tyrrhenica]